MKCPHCNTGIYFKEEGGETWQNSDYDQTKMGYEVTYGHCSECDDLIVMLRRGECLVIDESYVERYELQNSTQEELLYPKYPTRKVEQEVPNEYKRDFLEACAVLPVSPKASAALSRRLLQKIFREEFKINHPSLAREIEDFIHRRDVPSYLTSAVDAIRNVGNFAAHPLKETSAGEIMDVEPGEAEWLLDVHEALFDFAFVQPKRLEKRKEMLNDKLRAIGKPLMKG